MYFELCKIGIYSFQIYEPYFNSDDVRPVRDDEQTQRQPSDRQRRSQTNQSYIRPKIHTRALPLGRAAVQWQRNWNYILVIWTLAMLMFLLREFLVAYKYM